MPTSSTAVRNLLFERLSKDLVGPSDAQELITDRPSDRYLTGILYPQRTEVGSEQDEGLNAEGGDGVEPTPLEETSRLASTMRPASAGVSFAARSGPAAAATVQVRVR